MSSTFLAGSLRGNVVPPYVVGSVRLCKKVPWMGRPRSRPKVRITDFGAGVFTDCSLDVLLREAVHCRQPAPTEAGRRWSPPPRRRKPPPEIEVGLSTLPRWGGLPPIRGWG